MELRRALSMGGTAVVAATVGAACSFAFSGAIALNDAAGVQVSAAPVTVPAAAVQGVLSLPPASADAAGPILVPAPEPHDLIPPTARGGQPADAPGHSAPGVGSGSGSGSTSGDRGVGSELVDAGTVANPVAPGQTGELPTGSDESNRDTALAHAPGQDQKAGSEQSDPDSSHDADPGDADETSDPDTPVSGGG